MKSFEALILILWNRLIREHDVKITFLTIIQKPEPNDCEILWQYEEINERGK